MDIQIHILDKSVQIWTILSITQLRLNYSNETSTTNTQQVSGLSVPKYLSLQKYVISYDKHKH